MGTIFFSYQRAKRAISRVFNDQPRNISNYSDVHRLALLEKTEYLNDNHMLCALVLLKQAFPKLGGLESTLRQQKGLNPLPDRPSLQILHINVVASTTDCPPEADILLYDSLSLYTSINTQTKLLLAELVHSTKSSFTVGLANAKKIVRI